MKILRIVRCLTICIVALSVHDVIADVPGSPRRVLVRLEANDGTGRSMTKWVRRYGEFKLPPCRFKRQGYALSGWKDVEAGTEYAVGEKVYVYLGRTFKAVWKPLWCTKAMKYSIALATGYGDGDRYVEGVVFVKASKPNANTGISSVSATLSLWDGRRISFRGKTSDGIVAIGNKGESLSLRLYGSGGAYANHYYSWEAGSFLQGTGFTDGKSISLPSGTYYATMPIGACNVCGDAEYPLGVPMQIMGNRWTVATSKDGNPTRLRLSYNAMTGQFSGSFKGAVCGQKRTYKVIGAINNGEALGSVIGDCGSIGFSISRAR